MVHTDQYGDAPFLVPDVDLREGTRLQSAQQVVQVIRRAVRQDSLFRAGTLQTGHLCPQLGSLHRAANRCLAPPAEILE